MTSSRPAICSRRKAIAANNRQQGFATGGMGLWDQLHSSNSEPLMSALGH
jgi:hypothetical protein